MKTLFFSLIASTFLLSADPIYRIHDLDTLKTEGSIAKSLSESGCVAGQFYDKGAVIDFIWTAEEGLTILSRNGLKGAPPYVNNYGQVVGVTVEKTGTLWKTTKTNLYFFDPKKGLRSIGTPPGWESGDISIIAFNDQNRALIANHLDPFQATRFALWNHGSFITFIPVDGLYVGAMNHLGDRLVTTDSHSFFSFLSVYDLQIYNHDTKDFVTDLAHGERFLGIGINDARQIIAKDREEKKGFFWSVETGPVNLRDFIPSAINQIGEIVGTIQTGKQSSIYLRKEDGHMINISDSIDFRMGPMIRGLDRITSALNINGEGEILVSALINGKEHVLLLEPSY